MITGLRKPIIGISIVGTTKKLKMPSIRFFSQYVAGPNWPMQKIDASTMHYSSLFQNYKRTFMVSKYPDSNDLLKVR